MANLINLNCFIRWYDTASQAPAAVTNACILVANGYVQDPGRCDYQPILKHDEAWRFYINCPLGTNWIVENCVLNLVNNKTGVTQTVGIAPLILNKFTNTLGVASYNFYAEVIASDTVPEGQYRFEIVGSPSGTVFLTSNPFQVVAVTNDALLRGTTLAKFYHDRYLQGFRYNDLSDFNQQFRIHLNRIDQQFETNVEVYKEITTGQRRQFNAELDQIFTFESYYFDVWAHSAAAVMYAHEYVYLDTKRYVAKDTYRTDPNPRAKHGKGSCNCYDQEFSSANHCNP